MAPAHIPNSSAMTCEGNEKTAPKVFQTEVFEHPLGHGRPHVWVMDARNYVLFFQISTASAKLSALNVCLGDSRMFAGDPSRHFLFGLLFVPKC